MNVNHAVLYCPAQVHYSLGCLQLVVSGLSIMLRKKGSCYTASRKDSFLPRGMKFSTQSIWLQCLACMCDPTEGVGRLTDARWAETLDFMYKVNPRNAFCDICLIGIIYPYLLLILLMKFDLIKKAGGKI